MLQSSEGVFVVLATRCCLAALRKGSADPLREVSINACRAANTSAAHWKEQI